MAKAASKIITMLPSTPQVESVYLDPSNGILAGVNRLPASTPPTGRDPEETPSEPDIKRPHTVLIDQTTLDPTAASRIATTIHESTQGRALMLDAPVSGGLYAFPWVRVSLNLCHAGIVAAESGSLTIMLGSPSLLASSIAIPLLRRMAREGGVVECGGTGSGVGVKVCNK
jgi:3-hydroxyisobutyrate dehydrogenase